MTSGLTPSPLYSFCVLRTTDNDAFMCNCDCVLQGEGHNHNDLSPLLLLYLTAHQQEPSFPYEPHGAAALDLLALELAANKVPAVHSQHKKLESAGLQLDGANMKSRSADWASSSATPLPSWRFRGSLHPTPPPLSRPPYACPTPSANNRVHARDLGVQTFLSSRPIQRCKIMFT